MVVAGGMYRDWASRVDSLTYFFPGLLSLGCCLLLIYFDLLFLEKSINKIFLEVILIWLTKCLAVYSSLDKNQKRRCI